LEPDERYREGDILVQIDVCRSQVDISELEAAQ